MGQKVDGLPTNSMEGNLIYHCRDEELVGVTILHVSEVTSTQKK